MGRVLYWVAVLPLFLAVIVFAVSNHETVNLSLWPALTDPVPFPVYGIALAALFLGFVFGGIVSWFQGGATRRRLREAQRHAETEQRENASLRERLERLQAAEREMAIPPAPAAVAATPVAATPVAATPVAATPVAAAPAAATHASTTESAVAAAPADGAPTDATPVDAEGRPVAPERAPQR